MQLHLQRSAGRPRDLLRATENRAVAIRKLLKILQQRKGKPTGGVMDDAIRIVDWIERLARYGRNCDAADAAEIASHVEVLTSLLGQEIDDLLAS